MSISNFRAAEPLYIVILRNQQAENLLKSWVRENKIEHATVSGNRMMLHHRGAFDLFFHFHLLLRDAVFCNGDVAL